MTQVIYLDMDGTIADLYQGEWRADLIAEKVEPYKNAKRLIDEKTLLNLVECGYELGIISWTSKQGTKEYNAKVRKAKREWLKVNYPHISFTEIHIVKYNTPKHNVAKVKHQILVDDELQNRLAWKGQAFHPQDFFR